MRKVKFNLLIKYNKLITMLLSIMGFSTACEVIGGARVEYGTPHATFLVKGNISSASSNKPIPQIKVIMGYDTTYTDNEGNYMAKMVDFPTDQSYIIELFDVDGTQHGEFADTNATIDFIDPEFSGGDGNWNSGQTEKELDIKMKPKK